MVGWLRRLFREEEAQDLIEYAFLLAFVVIASVCMLGFTGSSFTGVAAVTNRNVEIANSIATDAGAGHH